MTRCALDKIYDGFAGIYEANRGLFDMSAVFASFWSNLAQERGCLLDLGCAAQASRLPAGSPIGAGV